ncbi:CRISPR-associated protein Csh2 [Methanomicrobium sp. W14]|uniref:type I-B CRISPR-associated protein Cas7/Csh2 n=1 Tax=Methanomicrobium sp. W14 TaxID=2817839 RepID=UPI001AE7516E|nr:type I-B CRISPR-associated protein Cas7/Csh2 [Methanomicrobium sp. W14]MBP2133627.1 CRISPR-associated protein Csh2 [Methanomicrobium sp. W14]
MSEIKNRSEIIFMYDIKDANPNGDPLDENKPRIDEDTMTNLVTDVRLKRTIRDYLYDFKHQEIFIKETRNENDTLKTKEERLDSLNIKTPDELIGKCVDIRLFGATTAIKKKSITFTGPVQFRIGRSVHPVQMKYVKGTTTMPSEKGKKQGTFTENYILPYSLIRFYGIINENAAKITKMTEEDAMLLLDGMWNGTKNLISRSKAGQVPRLLLKVNYKEDDYHIGDIGDMILADSEKPLDEVRDISELTLEIGELMRCLFANSSKIQDIEYQADGRVIFTENKERISLQEALGKTGIKLSELSL